MASESFYLSCLYFRICSSPIVISTGDRQPSELLAPPQSVHAGARQVIVVLSIAQCCVGFVTMYNAAYYFYYGVYFTYSFLLGRGLFRSGCCSVAITFMLLNFWGDTNIQVNVKFFGFTSLSFYLWLLSGFSVQFCFFL